MRGELDASPKSLCQTRNHRRLVRVYSRWGFLQLPPLQADWRRARKWSNFTPRRVVKHMNERPTLPTSSKRRSQLRLRSHTTPLLHACYALESDHIGHHNTEIWG